MKLTLAGPDDLGHWFLEDAQGNSWPLVERHEDQPAAAALFGWSPSIHVPGISVLYSRNRIPNRLHFYAAFGFSRLDHEDRATDARRQRAFFTFSNQAG